MEYYAHITEDKKRKQSVKDHLAGTAELAEKLMAECVAVIGRKVILYRRSSRKNFEHIQF